MLSKADTDPVHVGQIIGGTRYIKHDLSSYKYLDVS